MYHAARVDMKSRWDCHNKNVIDWEPARFIPERKFPTERDILSIARRLYHAVRVTWNLEETNSIKMWLIEI